MCPTAYSKGVFPSKAPQLFKKTVLQEKLAKMQVKSRKFLHKEKTRVHKRLQAVWLSSKHRQWLLPHHAPRAAQAAYEETSG